MIELNGKDLNLDKVWQIASGEPVGISASAMERVKASRTIVDKLIADDRVVYGITTGFGHLCNTRINRSDLERLQTNLIRSHATGVGDPFARGRVAH